MSTLDSGALQKPITLKEAYAEFRNYSMPWKLGFSILFLTTVAPAIIFIIFAAGISHSGGGMAFLAVLTVGGLIGLRDLYKEINEAALMRRFAFRNGMEYARDFYPKEYPGLPFRAGIYVPRAIRTTATPFFEFGYMRPAYSQRRSNNTETHTYIRLKLPRELPHIILKKIKGQSALPEVAFEGERLKLEGEFGDRFTLFAPTNYGQDALYLFTPDVMERFIDATPDFDCEIIGDEMYFYTHKKISLTSAGTIEKLAMIVNHVLQKFNRQSARYTDVTGARSNKITTKLSIPGLVFTILMAVLFCFCVILRIIVLMR